jgi:hypothetical protein
MAELKLIVPAKRPVSVKPGKPLKAEDPRAVLADIFVLLEGYGPLWYTEDLHNRAETALSERRSTVHAPRAR